MHRFITNAPAVFRCTANFAQAVVVNLNFFDAARETIPFHLSLRRDERLVVVNRRDRQGWRREIRFPVVFAHQALPVEVRFARGRAEVRIAGKMIGRFDAFPRPDREGRFKLRRGFKQLREVAFVEIDGVIVPGSLLMECPAIVEAPLRRMVLNDALEAVLDGRTPSDSDAVVLRIAGVEPPIPAVLRTLPYAAGRSGQRSCVLAAVVPGRAWEGGGERLEMTLTDRAGADLGSLSLTRAELVTRIGHLAVSGALAHDDRVALQAIEHTRHARILAQITPEERAPLIATAERFGLGRYLLANAPDLGAAPPAVARPVDPSFARIDAVRLTFMRSQRDDPHLRPVDLLVRLLDKAALSKAEQAHVFYALTEWFCVNGDLWDLLRLARDRGPDLPEQMPTADVWALTLLLPSYYAQGRFDDVEAALRRLLATNWGWASTPSIGWLAGQVAVSAPALDGTPLLAAQRSAIVAGISRWIEVQSRDYWGRTRCVALIRGFVALLVEADTLPRPDREGLIRQALWIYSLDPTFWDRVDAVIGQAVPPAMRAAQAAFARLRACLADKAVQGADGRAQIAAALAAFPVWSAQDLARVRRELLGPAGLLLAPGALPEPADILRAGMDPDEAALRTLAWPRDAPRESGQGRDMPLPFAIAAQNGLRQAYTLVPEGPFVVEQRNLLSDALALLQAPDDALLQRIMRTMVPLCGAQNQFLGLALGVSLGNALLGQLRDDEATWLLDGVARIAQSMAAQGQRDHLEIASTPGMALASLQRAHPGHPATQRVSAALGTCLVAQSLTVGPRLPGAPVNPLLNTLVCLYSCLPNLDTRIKVIRDGWMRLLADIGVPCLVFVGAGDGQRVGDVVHLDAPDDYEGLPQKTLAMVRWVLENTDFSYLLKIDDDCFLDPQAYFGDLTYQKFDYYGRPLTKDRGYFDRTWHMAKSTHPRGRLELDKSPGPSTHADGGAGYTLSRWAMMALGEAAQSPEGRELIHLSFMEDKLVGDLLALRNIGVVGEEYRISILRRTVPGGPPVPAWENGFLPFAGSGIKLAHLDGCEKQTEVLAGSHSPWPQSFKVWPSYQPARLGRRSNTLDLISSPGELARVNAAEVAVVACMRNEGFMIERFLDHYRALGVGGFLIADNGSDDGSFAILAEQPDVALFTVDTEYNASQYGVAWQQALIANFRTNRWSLVADADEFLFWTAGLSGSLPDLLREFDAEGATAVRTFMLDMYPRGSLGDADFKMAGPFEQAGYVDREPFLSDGADARGLYSNSSVWTSALRHRLIPGSRADLFVAQKYALLKYQPWMQLSAGLHFVANIELASRELFFAHFKYNAAFRAKAEAEVARQQHFNDAEEYRKYLALVSEGRDVVFDPAISVPWRDCDFVRQRLV